MKILFYGFITFLPRDMENPIVFMLWADRTQPVVTSGPYGY